MTSQGSASSLAKHRQSWLDLVSQASPPIVETAVVCSAQVHSRQPPLETEVEEEEETQQLESSSQHDSLDTGSPGESTPEEEEAEEEAQRAASVAQKGETLLLLSGSIVKSLHATSHSYSFTH